MQNCNVMTITGGEFKQTAEKAPDGRTNAYALESDANTTLTITGGTFTAQTYAVYLDKKTETKIDTSGT